MERRVERTRYRVELPGLPGETIQLVRPEDISGTDDGTGYDLWDASKVKSTFVSIV